MAKPLAMVATSTASFLRRQAMPLASYSNSASASASASASTKLDGSERHLDTLASAVVSAKCDTLASAVISAKCDTHASAKCDTLVSAKCDTPQWCLYPLVAALATYSFAARRGAEAAVTTPCGTSMVFAQHKIASFPAWPRSYAVYCRASVGLDAELDVWQWPRSYAPMYGVPFVTSPPSYRGLFLESLVVSEAPFAKLFSRGPGAYLGLYTATGLAPTISYRGCRLPSFSDLPALLNPCVRNMTTTATSFPNDDSENPLSILQLAKHIKDGKYDHRELIFLLGIVKDEIMKREGPSFTCTSRNSGCPRNRHTPCED